jgi:multisubunit Na+/H+ antiporter MnhB subunit
MLKPKKKITRKEIQRDPFLESVDQAQAHLEENRSLYMKAAIGLIVVLIGYNIMTEKSTQHKLDASAALGQALVALDRGDVTNAQFQLETVLNEFEGTPS